VSSFHFHHISSFFLSTPLSLGYYTSCFIHSSCHYVSPSYISCFIVFLLYLLLVHYIITTRHHVMSYTLLHNLSSVLSIPYHSHSFSHLKICYSYVSYTCKIFTSLLILLSGDIQSNPGPVSRVTSLNMCTLNIRSFTNPLHFTAIADLADNHNTDVFALSET